MSRRPPNPAAERAAQNLVTLKSLLKLESNKTCADCKKNKHPRWASWNLGIFVCIRCSGIHRSMGTHISRVKSVDLDSWTDEQLQSVLIWGNARANKYWEHKLDNGKGHVPQEAKIENFIRTKYDTKRWAMDGPRPDPATFDVEGDDDIPLSIVKEKQNIERKESIRKQSVGHSAAPPRAKPQEDLIGGNNLPPRPSTTGPSAAQQGLSKPTPPTAQAQKSVEPQKSAVWDLLNDEGPRRPASAAGTSGANGGQTRPDLKQSILSLYASVPRPQPPQQQQSNTSFGGFGGVQSPTSPTFGHQSQPSAGGGFDDAFANLSFGNTASATPKSPPKDAFAGLGSFSSNRSTPQATSSFSNLGGGSFFDAKPAKPAAPQQTQPSTSSFDGFGDWGAPAAPTKPAQPASSSLGDLFDFSSSAPPPAPMAQPAAALPKPASTPIDSVFNLSQPKPAQPAPAPAAPLNASAFNNSDVWGNAWGEPAAPAAPAQKSPEVSKPSTFGGSEWGSTGGSLAASSITLGGSGFSTQSSFSMTGASQPAQPEVKGDEEFGGWTSSTATNSAATNNNTSGTTKQGGGFGNEDLFSNVWQ